MHKRFVYDNFIKKSVQNKKTISDGGLKKTVYNLTDEAAKYFSEIIENIPNSAPQILRRDIETLFMMTNSDYACVSSSAIKQIGKFGGSVQGLIPDEIIKDFNYKLNVAWGKENE